MSPHVNLSSWFVKMLMMLSVSGGCYCISSKNIHILKSFLSVVFNSAPYPKIVEICFGYTTIFFFGDLSLNPVSFFFKKKGEKKN